MEPTQTECKHNANLHLRVDSELALISFISAFFSGFKPAGVSVSDRVLIIYLSQQIRALSSGVGGYSFTLGRAKIEALDDTLIV